MRPFRPFRPAVAAALVLAASCAGASADKIKNPTAVFAGLDKITGRIISFEAAVDETVQFGSLQLTTRVCYSRPEYEKPQTTTFVEVEDVSNDNQFKRIFGGWMYAESPGLHAIEHPVYDIWLTECKGGTQIIKSPPEQDEVEEIAPPSIEAAKRQTRPAVATNPGRQMNPASGAPLRLPDAAGVPLPPGAIVVRPQPQQRFFPTNAPSNRGGLVYDPAGSGR